MKYLLAAVLFSILFVQDVRASNDDSYPIDNRSSSIVKWSNNYHMSRQKAQKEGKDILLFVCNSTHPSYEYMKEDVLGHNKVVDLIKNNYIPVEISWNDIGIVRGINILKGMDKFARPTIFFLTGKGKYMKNLDRLERNSKPIMGTMNATQLKKILEAIK